MEQCKQVLTVGDGDFTYSLALCSIARTNKVVATSYDSKEQVIQKYAPKVYDTLQRLSEVGCTVLHGVNATTLHSDKQLNTLETNRFDMIKFQHPHCGVEDAQRHRILLAHFFSSSVQILQLEGKVEISVSLEQAERWKIQEQALKAGLHLIESKPFDFQQYPGYMPRRHQANKTFKNDESILYIFARAPLQSPSSSLDADIRPQNGSVQPHESGNQQSKKKHKCNICDKEFSTEQGLRTHTHMVHELYVNKEKQQCWCQACDRYFESAEGYQQHVKAKHGEDGQIKPDWYQPNILQRTVLQSTPLSAQSAEIEKRQCEICQFYFQYPEEFELHLFQLQPEEQKVFNCENCNRRFLEERALRQHKIECNQVFRSNQT
eukprot:TRINITY_DN7728_c0_g2_i3.p1 TRINITY_DN7728_c0_g2~~TRINITY_DN7728_c0_g2_i3.p1  ORF type:complete len:377 (+),score=14.50 TRINITY_DN7728_c0_g2_i3:96-1226(+)